MSKISNAFMAFNQEAPAHAKVWVEMVVGLSGANVLDNKTGSLAYLAVLAALGSVSGIPFHVAEAQKAGASRDEIISAILIGLPAAGHRVTQALPPAIAALDE
jgi:alkylhydroperoxidase/carboxymuconolactone decarboxylase family protein YurZ